ncbi:MAG: ABC transporter permease [Anaerolineaceae bacterium]|nr:ABC transporter permease [Anaerolineaceae bacterium]
MKRLMAIMLKDNLIRFTSPLEWLFFLILPVIFTFILSGGTGEASDSRILLYVVDQAQSSLSISLISELERSTSVKPEVTSLNNAQSAFESRKVSAVLVLPEDLSMQTLQAGNAEVELWQQPSNTNALIARQGIQAAVNRVSSSVDIANISVNQASKIKPFSSESARQVFFDQALATAQDLMNSAPRRVVEIKGVTPDPVSYDPRANSSLGQMITWVFIPLIGLSAMFAMERQAGTLRRILVTPTSKATIIAGTVIGQVLTALVQMVILILFGIFVMKINWGESPLAVALMITSSALAAGALGTMLGTFVKTEGQANGLSIMVGMVMAMMGGCWYPIELFPAVIRNIVKIFPTTWAMQGMLDIVTRGQGVSGVWLEAAVLFGFALVFFVIGVWRFKYE